MKDIAFKTNLRTLGLTSGISDQGFLAAAHHIKAGVMRIISSGTGDGNTSVRHNSNVKFQMNPKLGFGLGLAALGIVAYVIKNWSGDGTVESPPKIATPKDKPIPTPEECSELYTGYIKNLVGVNQYNSQVFTIAHRNLEKLICDDICSGKIDVNCLESILELITSIYKKNSYNIADMVTAYKGQGIPNKKHYISYDAIMECVAERCPQKLPTE